MYEQKSPRCDHDYIDTNLKIHGLRKSNSPVSIINKSQISAITMKINNLTYEKYIEFNFSRPPAFAKNNRFQP